MMQATSGTIWNGGICGTCGARYLGSHQCSQADILRRVNELLALLPGTPQDSCRDNPARDPGSCRPDATRTCPCRPENGGSGVCVCILSGAKVTC